MYSPAFYATCTFGGILTHMAVTPLHLVKCNIHVDPAKYKSISSGFGVLLKEQGVKGFFRGWVPTLLGYSAQGACKFILYEFFKKYYSDIAGPEFVAKYKTLIYLAGSSSAEVIADIALCPFESVKVRVQKYKSTIVCLVKVKKETSRANILKSFHEEFYSNMLKSWLLKTQLTRPGCMLSFSLLYYHSIDRLD